MSVTGAPAGGDPMQWRKSSYSGAGNDCVEVAFPAAAAVRDSKDPCGGVLRFSPGGWRGFLRAVSRCDE